MTKTPKKPKKSRLEKVIEKEGLTEKEAAILLQSARGKPFPGAKLDVSNKGFMYMRISDTHIGHEKFLPELFDLVIKMEKKYKPDFIIHSGDHLEGMSGRPGHIYELTHVGFDQQMNYCTDLYSQLKSTMFGIDGNHDEWYAKKSNNGVIVGNELERRLDNFVNLGQMEGDLLVNGIHIKLFHANDGTSYADSYKLQKLTESFTGGEKPHIVISGHYHKQLYMFLRNIHGYENGTLMGQSRWMRGKKIRAAIGFGFTTVYIDKKGVNRIINEWIPYYELDRTKFYFRKNIKLKNKFKR